jgi:hypothetical protein
LQALQAWHVFVLTSSQNPVGQLLHSVALGPEQVAHDGSHPIADASAQTVSDETVQGLMRTWALLQVVQTWQVWLLESSQEPSGQLVHCVGLLIVQVAHEESHGLQTLSAHCVQAIEGY